MAMIGETILTGAPKGRGVSDFKVMRSGAGYYIGTTVKLRYGVVPNTRESNYFPTYESADHALMQYQTTGFLPNAR